MTYRIAPFLMTSSDFLGTSPTASFFRIKFSIQLCGSRQDSSGTERRAVPLRQLSLFVRDFLVLSMWRDIFLKRRRKICRISDPTVG